MQPSQTALARHPTLRVCASVSAGGERRSSSQGRTDSNESCIASVLWISAKTFQPFVQPPRYFAERCCVMSIRTLCFGFFSELDGLMLTGRLRLLYVCCFVAPPPNRSRRLFCSAICVALMTALSGCTRLREHLKPEMVYVVAKQTYLRDGWRLYRIGSLWSPMGSRWRSSSTDAASSRPRPARARWAGSKIIWSSTRRPMTNLSRSNNSTRTIRWWRQGFCATISTCT